MTGRPFSSRRIFLADLGKVTIGLAVLGAAACSADPTPTAPAPSTTAANRSTPATTSTSTSTQPSTTSPPDTASPSETPVQTGAIWERVDLGNVSAYIVVRAGEATVVDTGNPDSEGTIEQTLGLLNAGWNDVAHVILTHDHRDHQGSIGAVLASAAGAEAYAGAEDIADIVAPRALIPVGDGDTVAGLAIVATPGHTPGHIAVLDTELRLLIAGDALVGENGGVAGPIDRFTADLETAHASVQKLARLDFDTVVFGHGDPVVGGASSAVAQLASQL